MISSASCSRSLNRGEDVARRAAVGRKLLEGGGGGDERRRMGFETLRRSRLAAATAAETNRTCAHAPRRHARPAL